jgi:DNA-directed RNA polymerase subunit RPC12/RpoP
MWNAFPTAMSEFKFVCPVCGQHIKCDSSQGGSTIECPTCFQKIIAPQAPATDDPKFILTGTKVGGERPLPTGGPDAGPATAPEKHFPIGVFIVLLCAAAAAVLVFRGRIFKSTAGPAGPGITVANETSKPAPPKPIVGPAIVVFGKGESNRFEVGITNAEVKDPAKAAFLAAFKADLAAPSAYAGPLPLTTHTGVGREVPTATGDIRYHESFPGGLVIGVTLGGLVPNHEYVLTINGAVQHDGNNNLPDEFPPGSPQKFFDFSPIATDANGSYRATFGVRLPPGPYDVYFFVKDPDDWKIVLGYDLFRFTVK